MVKKLVLITLFPIFIINHLYGLNFQVSELISIPGNNRNFDILQIEPVLETSHICWQNTLNSCYTIYLKQLQPTIGENIVVYSNSGFNINPQIAVYQRTDCIRIVWQSKIDDQWQLLQRFFANDTLSQVEKLFDYSIDSTEFSLSENRIAYINNGNLMVKSFSPGFEGYNEPILIDSGFCSNPDMIYEDYSFYHSIVYEKGIEDNKQIYKAELLHYRWVANQLSEGSNNINPKFGASQCISYQTLINNFWRIMSPDCEYYISNNQSCNFCNPFFYYFPPQSKVGSEYTPYFMVFDSDSLINNQDIFIDIPYVNKYQEDTIMNISNSPGYDEKPIATVVIDSITIIWEHTENNKTDIWWAKDKFFPYPFGISDEQYSKESSTFLLDHNYPNPFNPSTIISFQIRESISKKAVIKIYNSIGELVRTIPKNINGTGYYSVSWDGKSGDGNILPTGNYIYSINYGNISKTGKMTLVK